MAILNYPGSGEYQNAVLSNNVFCASQQTGITLAAALRVDPGGLALYNPVGSGVNAVLIWAGWSTTVIWAAVSPVWLGINSNIAAAAATGTAATVRNCLIGGTGTPQCSALVAPTLPAVPVAGPLLGVGLTGAVNLDSQRVVSGRKFAGSVIVRPGCTISFQSLLASGTSGFWGELIWQEVAVAAALT